MQHFIIKRFMDTKTVRKNFYLTKSYLANKYDEQYSAERFAEDLQYMLDEFIPNATMKRLTKFMEKKYNRILKKFPQIETALKKVLKERLNTITLDLKKTQKQKIFAFINQEYPNMKFVLKGEDEYELTPLEQQDPIDHWKSFAFEEITIKLPKDIPFAIERSKKKDPQAEYYKITCSNPSYVYERWFASTETISQEKFCVGRGNFERQANNFLDKLRSFFSKMEQIENPDYEQ